MRAPHRRNLFDLALACITSELPLVHRVPDSDASIASHVLADGNTISSTHMLTVSGNSLVSKSIRSEDNALLHHQLHLLNS